MCDKRVSGAEERYKRMPEHAGESIKLPGQEYESGISVEEALLKRRSVRDFKDISLSLAEVSQVLWAAQGRTKLRGMRTIPSAGALYPLELYVVAGNVEALPAGVYKYRPDSHELTSIVKGDKRGDLCSAALGQSSVRKAAAVIVLSGVYKRTTTKYGERGIRYVHMEAGHAAQNVYLQTVPLRLGTVVIGAFRDEEVAKVLNMPDGETPLYLMPVGKI